MSPDTGERPPYRAALVVFALALAGYVGSLAPSVTFWDAGELIASSKILGIPHPPGTPLFVMVAHVWGLMLPVGEFAWRTNLLSAVFSAAGAALWFLAVHEVLRPRAAGLTPAAERLVRLGGAVAAALLGAFGFTHWQNSNETEVYSVATFTIAAIVWLALRWRTLRGSPAATRMLLLAVYLGRTLDWQPIPTDAAPLAIPALMAQWTSQPSASGSARSPGRRSRCRTSHGALLEAVRIIRIGCPVGLSMPADRSGG